MSFTCVNAARQLDLGLFSEQVKSFITPNPAAKHELDEVKQSVESVCKRAFPKCEAVMTGSQATFIVTGESDLDLSICFPQSEEWTNDEKQKELALESISNELIRENKLHDSDKKPIKPDSIRLIVSAAPPIVKLTLSTGLDIDIAIESLDEKLFTQLLRAANHVDPRFRPVACAIKLFSQQVGVYGDGNRYPSANAMFIMLIHRWQNFARPIFSLVDVKKIRIDEPVVAAKAATVSGVSALRSGPLEPPPGRGDGDEEEKSVQKPIRRIQAPDDKRTVGELVADFAQFVGDESIFASYDFDISKIPILHAADSYDDPSELVVDKPMMVKCPITGSNAARNVGLGERIRFSAAFKTLAIRLQTESIDIQPHKRQCHRFSKARREREARRKANDRDYDEKMDK